MKVVCSVIMRSTKPRCFRLCCGVLESSQPGGVHGFGSMKVGLCAKVLEYWIIFSLKIKLNCSWKFWRNWNVPLVLLETSLWAGFNGILFGKICCLIRQAVIGKFSHNTGYINKNLNERRRSKNPIRRNINMKRKRSTKELEMEKHQKDMRKETERNTGKIWMQNC